MMGAVFGGEDRHCEGVTAGDGEHGPPLNYIEYDAFLECSGVPCDSQGVRNERRGRHRL